jgi:hypothetical protein
MSSLSLSAATSSSIRVVAGSPETRAANACSSLVVNGNQDAEAASSPAGPSAIGSSTMASGLPAASRSVRSRIAGPRPGPPDRTHRGRAGRAQDLAAILFNLQVPDRTAAAANARDGGLGHTPPLQRDPEPGSPKGSTLSGACRRRTQKVRCPQGYDRLRLSPSRPAPVCYGRMSRRIPSATGCFALLTFRKGALLSVHRSDLYPLHPKRRVKGALMRRAARTPGRGGSGRDDGAGVRVCRRRLPPLGAAPSSSRSPRRLR